ncbi:MAG: hypothetical protein KAT74_06690, partial [Candidatus Cloacimonetes bacterium]|nr:hypothetical protein [Candidatus Cloacimonadota bacterium]
MKLKKLILFIIIFSIISTYATEYEVLENIHLGNRIGTILTEIEDNTYFIKHRKTINKIIINNNGFEIIDTKYFENFICKPIIHNNLLIAPTWFNNINIYQITDNDLILVNSLGLETCEEYIIYYYAINLCGNYIFYRYYLYNFETEIWENHMDIYDMENNYELIVAEVMDTQNIVVEVIKIGDIYYFFKKNGEIGYTDNEVFDISSLNQVTYSQPSDLYLEGASLLENKLYIYFTDYEEGFFKIYNFENDSILVEETSIEILFLFNPNFFMNNNYLYIWGLDITGSDTILRKYYVSGSEYILENQETYYDQGIGSIIQLEGNYLVFGGSQIFFMDSDLNTIEIIQDDLFDIYIIDTMLDRFILLKINELTGSDYLFYDIIDHEYLDFSLPNYYWYHYQFQKRSFDNYFLFQSGNHLKVIYFYEDGDYEIFDYSIPETSYDADIYNNIIAIETIQGDDHYCTFYQVINDELEYLNSTMLNHYVHALLFVDNEHIAIMETYMGNIFIYYYRMNPDYSLDIIDSFQVY